MPKSKYDDLSDSIAAGGWLSETEHEGWKSRNGGKTATAEQLKVACLMDMMRSLRKIARILDCPKVRAMAVAARNIEVLLKAELAKKKKKPGRKARRQPA